MYRATFVSILSAVMPLAGCAHQAKTKTVPEVEQRIEAALPVGSSRQEIEDWLKREKVVFSFNDKDDLQYTSTIKDRFPDLSPFSGAISGVYFDTDWSAFVAGNIQMYFLLGTDGRLSKTIVKWIGTGP